MTGLSIMPIMLCGQFGVAEVGDVKLSMTFNTAFKEKQRQDAGMKRVHGLTLPGLYS